MERAFFGNCWVLCGLLLVVACGDSGASDAADGAAGDGDGEAAGVAGAGAEGAAPSAVASAGDGLLTPDPDPITRAEDARPGVFIQPFTDCREPLDGVPGDGPDGQVCTQVAISGATEAGRYFPDYGSCDVVRTQRPFFPTPAAAQPDPQDPRLQDAEYMEELAWAKSQIGSTACTCCHDSGETGGPVGQWDIAAEGIWITTLSDSGLALFAGLADSSVFGAYPPQDNNGFDRERTGIPTSDTDRMLAFLRQEMEHRGLSEAQARQVPPFGGPIYAASVAVPEECGPGQGVSPDGIVQWTGGSARYLYVMREGAANPGVPPNLDLPDGTLWRLDVRADAPALSSGVAYGSEPEGTLQRTAAGAPELVVGERYQLSALLDVGLAVTSCVFTFGEEPPAEADPPTGVALGQDAQPIASAESCGDGEGFGASCQSDADCGCEAASYCALMPGQSSGGCTATGCIEDPGVCPDDWSCFDVSIFAPGQPSICLAP